MSEEIDLNLRFQVAISYSVEQIEFVQQVVTILARELGRKSVLFDRFHESEFARCDLGRHLLALYETSSDLIAAMICPSYKQRRWCRDEWEVIRRVSQRRPEDVMLLKFGEFPLEDLGLSATDGFLDVFGKRPEEVAACILDRLKLNRISSITRNRAIERLIQRSPPPYRNNIRRVYNTMQKTLDGWRRGGSGVALVTAPPEWGKSKALEIALKVFTGDAPELAGCGRWVTQESIRQVDLAALVEDGRSFRIDKLFDGIAAALFEEDDGPRPRPPSQLTASDKLRWLMNHEAAGQLQVISGHEMLERSAIGEKFFNAWLRNAACLHPPSSKCVIVLSQRSHGHWKVEGSPFNVGEMEELGRFDPSVA